MKPLLCQAMLVGEGRGQASLETLVVAAALLVFLAAFLPFVSETRALAEYGEAAVQEKIFLKTLAEDAKQARLLGGGNVFSREFFLPANKTFLEFNETSEALELVFEEGARNGSFEEFISFGVVFVRQRFGRGKIYYTVRNEDGVIRASFSR